MSKVPDPKDYKKPAKNVNKVVTEGVRVKDKSLGRRFWQVFQLRDLSEIKGYIYEDLVVPGFKKAIRGIVDIILDGEVRPDRSRGNGYRIDYRGMSDGRSKSRERDDTPKRKRRDFRELIFDSRGDAEEVLSNMCDIIRDYERASIADLYDLCDITGEFTDNKYGWEDLSGSGVRRVSEGYILDLPKAVLLD